MRGKSLTCRRILSKILRSLTAKGSETRKKKRGIVGGKSETCRASEWQSQSTTVAHRVGTNQLPATQGSALARATLGWRLVNAFSVSIFPSLRGSEVVK